MAVRLRDAAAIGDVTGLQALAQELAAGDASARLLGDRVARLMSEFDFEALRQLAASLAADTGDPAC
jgi:hypothetical protein